MKLMRMFTAVVAVLVLAGVAYVNQATETTGAKMAAAAEKFLGTLKDDQKAKATFSFDDKERTNWHFVPHQDNKQPKRLGLSLDRMTNEQREAALELVRAGTSMEGYDKAKTIMSLESILHALEMGGANVRDPNWYFFSVFGTPSKTGKWGWRVEGHHLSLNFTVDKGAVVSSTPAFFGSNPAVVMNGERKGLRTLAEVDDLAKDLFIALDEDQKKVALQEKQFNEINEETIKPPVGAPVGLAAAKMTDQQKAILQKLLDTYAQRIPPEVAAEELKQVKEAGFDKVHFAFAGAPEAGKPHTYRVQGPTFVIEFLNMQPDAAKNPANHIHSAWRNIKGDFGLTAN